MKADTKIFWQQRRSSWSPLYYIINPSAYARVLFTIIITWLMRAEKEIGGLWIYYCDARARVKYLMCMHMHSRGVCVLCVATINIKRCGEIGPLCDRRERERCNSIPHMRNDKCTKCAAARFFSPLYLHALCPCIIISTEMRWHPAFFCHHMRGETIYFHLLPLRQIWSLYCSLSSSL